MDSLNDSPDMWENYMDYSLECGASMFTIGQKERMLYYLFNDPLRRALLDSPSLLEPAIPQDTIPQDTIPQDTIPQDTIPQDTIPQDTIPQDTIPQDTIPQDTIPQDTIPQDTIPQDTIPQDTIPQDTIPQDTIPQDTIPQDTIPQDTIPQDTIPQDTIPQDTIPQDTIPPDTIPQDTIPQDTSDIATFSNAPIDSNQLLQLYPNPTDGTLSIKVPKQLEVGTLEIYDLHGRLVLQANSPPTELWQINVRQIPDGLYLLRYSNGKKTYVSKFVKTQNF